MKILSIETSCDETAIAILEVKGFFSPTCTVIAHGVASQASLHAQYGGVFPAMAKREHAKNIAPLTAHVFKEANLFNTINQTNPFSLQEIERILEREPELFAEFQKTFTDIAKPDIDRIAVTIGPGLEPALWVGINFARALSTFWNIPVVPVNHMEGHVLSTALTPDTKSFKIRTLKKQFPSLSLLVSGGHTELVLAKRIGDYTILGQTRDDAVGEAFDKVARMLDLPYPGGPEISRLAKEAREKYDSKDRAKITLPRPMLHSPDFDFSFSGIKTAVLYMVRDMKKMTEKNKALIAVEFEDSAIEVLVAKTLRAAKKYKTKQIIVGGGVAANTHLRETLTEKSVAQNIHVVFPTRELSTDNAVMIGIAGYFGKIEKDIYLLRAHGNMQL